MGALKAKMLQYREIKFNFYINEMLISLTLMTKQIIPILTVSIGCTMKWIQMIVPFFR